MRAWWSRLALASWPVRYAVSLLFGVALWPFALQRAWQPLSQLGIWVVLGWPFMGAVQDRRWNRLTGWDRARRIELVRAARRGALPEDPTDRDRLRQMVAAEFFQNRGMQWLGLVYPAFGGLLFFHPHRLHPVVLVIAVAWYALLGALFFHLGRTVQNRRSELLDRLSDADGEAGGDRLRAQPLE